MPLPSPKATLITNTAPISVTSQPANSPSNSERLSMNQPDKIRLGLPKADWTQPPVGECIIFPGRKQKGYGYVKFNGKDVRAHRVAWETANQRPVPDGLSVCHRCDNPSCVNPDHLFVADQQTNVRDRDRKGRATKGSAHPKAKLTEMLVRVIRRSTLSHRDLGRILGIHDSVLFRARHRQTWKHVP